MKNFRNYIKDEFNIEMPKGNIPGDWFSKNGLPMVVRCTCCDMSMVSPSAWLNDDGECFCADCAGVND